jgi:hypothetical protein
MNSAPISNPEYPRVPPIAQDPVFLYLDSFGDCVVPYIPVTDIPIEGFQLGLSYTPNSQQEGSEAPKTKSKKIFDKNNIVGQISYENSFDNGTSIV